MGGWGDGGIEGCRVGQREEMLSVVLAVIKAMMHMGHSDLRLFLSWICQHCSAVPVLPFLALCCPCRLCLDTVCLSPCVCVCMSHSSSIRPQMGGFGKVCEVTRVTCY